MNAWAWRSEKKKEYIAACCDGFIFLVFLISTMHRIPQYQIYCIFVHTKTVNSVVGVL